MRNSIIEISGHLSDETIIRLKKGTLTYDEQLEALTHIGECKVCGNFFAQSFLNDELLTVPPQFSERVLKEAGRIREPKTRQKGIRAMREFYAYAARVAVAMCLSLMMLFSSPFNTAVSAIEVNHINTINLSKVDAFNEGIREISDKIVNLKIKQLEVDKNDQKKK